MSPRLVLLTGPNASNVANVLTWLTHPYPAVGTFGLSPEEIAQEQSRERDAAQWDEVRDYWEAPRCIAGAPDALAVEHGIREYPGGEEWLVGLVLPEAHMTSRGLHLTCGHSNIGEGFTLSCSTCRKYVGLPARLAILAPAPPLLLMERVKAWGGETWWCEGTGIYDVPHGALLWAGPTWPEAVRAALGDAP